MRFAPSKLADKFCSHAYRSTTDMSGICLICLQTEQAGCMSTLAPINSPSSLRSGRYCILKLKLASELLVQLAKLTDSSLNMQIGTI